MVLSNPAEVQRLFFENYKLQLKTSHLSITELSRLTCFGLNNAMTCNAFFSTANHFLLTN